MSRLLTHWNSIPGKPGFKTIGGQSIFGSGDIAVSDSSKVPYTGATQGLNMGLYDIQATRFQFGSTGPRLDAAIDGTVRVRTNDGLADAPLSASNLTLSGNQTVLGNIDALSISVGGSIDSSELLVDGTNINQIYAQLNGGNILNGNQIIGNPSGLGPSPYLSAVNSFSEATLELRNSLTNGYTGLNLGSLVASGSISAGSLTASGKIRSDAAVVTSAGVQGANGPSIEMGFTNYGFGVNANGEPVSIINATVRNQLGTDIVVGSNGSFGIGNAAHAGTNSTVDVKWVRNATGPMLETRAVGGLKVCNADGSALAALNCGRANVTDFNAGSGTIFVNSATGRLLIYNNGMLGWTGSGTAETSPDTGISRASSGVLQIGTTSNNALGSLNLANLTASGVFTTDFGSGVDIQTQAANWRIGHRVGGTFRTGFDYYHLNVHSSYLVRWSNSSSSLTTMDTTLSRASAGVLQIGNASGANALGSLNLANLTASGSVLAAGGNAGCGGGGMALNWTGVSSGMIAGGQFIVYENGTNRMALIDSMGMHISSGHGIRFGSAASGSGSADVGLKRKASSPGVIEINNGTWGNSSGSIELTNVTALGVVTSAFRSLSADPTTLDITAGLSQLVKNTTSGEIRLWVNDGGVMKKSAALT